MQQVHGSHFRPDIQGIRALAVALVLLWHAGVTWLPNGYVGVDAFFVVSGFLITGILLRERQTTGRVSLSRFYARRARRLLPAACVTIAVTVVATMVLVPELRWSTISGDAWASTFYVQNWRLAGRAVDYRIGLINRIGLAAVEALEADNRVRKWTRGELIEIRARYAAKRKELENGQAARP